MMIHLFVSMFLDTPDRKEGSYMYRQRQKSVATRSGRLQHHRKTRHAQNYGFPRIARVSAAQRYYYYYNYRAAALKYVRRSSLELR